MFRCVFFSTVLILLGHLDGAFAGSSVRRKLWTSCYCRCGDEEWSGEADNTSICKLKFPNCKASIQQSNCQTRGGDGGDSCIGGNNLLFSCTEGKAVAARNVNVGDKVKALRSETSVTASDEDAEDDATVCSEVYYVFRHKGNDSDAIRFEVDGGKKSFVVGFNHLVYVGETFEDRKAVVSQDVKIGDKLATSDGKPAMVVGIEPAKIDLVNVLTFEPHLVLQNDESGGSGIIISPFSFDETYYWALFAPVRAFYNIAGPSSVKYLEPFFSAIDANLAKPGLRLATKLNSMWSDQEKAAQA